MLPRGKLLLFVVVSVPVTPLSITAARSTAEYMRVHRACPPRWNNDIGLFSEFTKSSNRDREMSYSKASNKESDGPSKREEGGEEDQG